MVYLFLIIGFVLLVKGADLFVDGSAAVADRFRIPPVIIGLTIVAFGTSAPETAVSISAAIAGSNDIAVANVVGSNIFNLLAVVGVSALIAPFAVKKSIMKKEYPFSIAVSAILLLMCTLGGSLGRIDGIILLVVFAVFLFDMVYRAIKTEDTGNDEIKKLSPVKSIIFIAVGLVAIVTGGDVVVDSATEIAGIFGMSEILIGLTIVALGTSLPELVTSVVAAFKGQNDIAIGNVIGSNIFNILLVLGLSSVITPIAISSEAIADMVVLIGVSIAAYIMTFTNRRISRREAAVMIIIYAVYMVYIIMR